MLRKMRILDVSPFGVVPPRSGGHTRIHRINLVISQFHEITLFAQGLRRFELTFPLRSHITQVNDTYQEFRYVTTGQQIGHYISTLGNKLPPVFSGELLDALKPSVLRELTEICDIIQIENPWQFSCFSKESKPIVLAEHDVNQDLLANSFNKKTPISNLIFKKAVEKEQFALETADVIICVSDIDKNRICELYGISPSKIKIVPNGVAVNEFTLTKPEEKEALKRKMGFRGKKIILFAGSKHKPNIDAVEQIIKIADGIKNPEVLFIIAGSVGNYFSNTKNMHFTKAVEDIHVYFKMADVALNPMSTGSGTNLKLLEYLASGIPTVTTNFGARGLAVEHARDVVISKISDFQSCIEELLENEQLCCHLVKSGRSLVEKNYDWNVLASHQCDIYEKLAP